MKRNNYSVFCGSLDLRCVYVNRINKSPYQINTLHYFFFRSLGLHSSSCNSSYGKLKLFVCVCV